MESRIVVADVIYFKNHKESTKQLLSNFSKVVGQTAKVQTSTQNRKCKKTIASEHHPRARARARTRQDEI